MSEKRDRPRLRNGLILIGLILLMEFVLWATRSGCVGHCPAGYLAQQNLLYPGSLVIAVPAIIIVAFWALRKDRND